MVVEYNKGIYPPKIAAKVARIRYQNFQAWAKANLLHPTFQIQWDKKTESIYSYYDLLLIRLIKRLRDKGFRTKVIKATLDTISTMSEGDPLAWTRSTIIVNANMIVVYLSDKPEWNPVAASRGPQKLEVIFFPELIVELGKELIPDRFRYIEINPTILGGAPVIKGTRIATSIVYNLSKETIDIKEAYPQLKQDQIEEAISYEEFLRQVDIHS